MIAISKGRAIKMLRASSERVIAIAEHAGPARAFEPETVPRLIGIQNVSRDWSVMMVIEHLTLVNRDVLKLIGALKDDVTPRGELDLEDYRPDLDLGWDAIDRHRDVLADLDSLVSSASSLQSVAYFRHPWFGMLNAHQWLCFAAFHQRIHLRQAQRIVAIQGVS